jgi:hypothetical protein
MPTTTGFTGAVAIRLTPFFFNPLQAVAAINLGGEIAFLVLCVPERVLEIAPRFGHAQHARVAADVFSPLPTNHDPGIFPDSVGQLERVVGPVLEDNAALRGTAGVGAGEVQRQTVMDADPAGLRLDRREAMRGSRASCRKASWRTVSSSE